MTTYRPVILLADDAPENLKMLEKLLGQIDAELAFAEDGNGALEMAREIKPDLVLLDIMMPGMDGFEVCHLLKEDSATRDASVIFLTALSETEDIIKGFEAGAVDYVSKPFKAAELLARVKNHLRIKQVTRELELANSMKNKFFSIIAHDLKNPFSTITGFAEMMLKRLDRLEPGDMQKYIRLIYNSGKDASELLENLLNWSRLQVGTFKSNPYYLDSAELVSRVVQFLEPMAKRKNIELLVKKNERCEVFADENMLETVLRNLGTNAIKFTHEGGKVTFRAGAYNSSDYFYVEVQDNGIGMSEEVKNNLFRIDTKSSRKGTFEEEGSGLGLVLSHEFVQFLGGNIEVESEENAGSIFTVKLPLQNRTNAN